MFVLFLQRLILGLATLGLFVVPQWLFLSSVTFLQSAGELGETAKSQSEKLKTYTQHNFYDIEVSVYESGQSVWFIQAESAQNQSLQDWKFLDVDGVFKGEKSNQISFTSQTGLLNRGDETLTLKDQVRCVSSRGYVFRSENLMVNKANEDTVFTTDKKVTFYTIPQSDIEVEAVGLKGELNSGVIDLLSKVRSTKETEQYDEVTIESDRAQITSSLKSIEFYENLNVIQNKFKIKGEEAKFNIGKTSNEIESIQILGDIVASDGFKTALSDRVDLKVKEDAIIFQGSPRIRVGDNEMVGEEILITNNQQNVQVIRGNIKSTNKRIDLESEDETND